MTRLDFLLGLEGPEFNRDGAYDDVVGDWVVSESIQDVVGAVDHSIDDGLNALVVSCVPNLNHLVCTKTDQMISLFIDVKMAD